MNQTPVIPWNKIGKWKEQPITFQISIVSSPVGDKYYLYTNRTETVVLDQYDILSIMQKKYGPRFLVYAKLQSPQEDDMRFLISELQNMAVLPIPIEELVIT
jgi:hypothetical protein